MRVYIKIAAAFALLGAGVMLGRHSKVPSQAVVAANDLKDGEKGRPLASAMHRPAQETTTSEVVGRDGSSEDSKSLLAEMEQAAAEYDQPNLTLYERGLKHSDPSVRLAACDALIRLSAQDAVPLLHAAAERASDPAEVARMEEAAKFLEMPEVTTELSRGNPVNSATPKQPLRRMKITPVE